MPGADDKKVCVSRLWTLEDLKAGLAQDNSTAKNTCSARSFDVRN